MLQANFANGDYVLLSYERHTYYRKHLINRGSVAYAITHIKRDSAVPRGPIANNIRKAIETGISKKQFNVHDALQLFMPKHEETEVIVPEHFRILEKKECAEDDSPNEYLVKVYVTKQVDFQHPLHPTNTDRVFKVEPGTVSGWMPYRCLPLNVWVTSDSEVSLDSHVENSIISGGAKVRGSRVTGSWLRGGTCLDSNIAGSVFHKTGVIDSDITDCGLRKSTVRESLLERSSLSGSNVGACLISDSRVTELTSVVSVIVDSLVDSMSVESSHLIRCTASCGDRILSSTITDATLQSLTAIETNVSGTPQCRVELGYDLYLFGKSRDNAKMTFEGN